ncbi:protease modulator HflC [Sneathiella glossodoripedis]|uniref:protease modulator HflC n=1 Tax=Sneathiella glossodoripedis TaxID=418853 RepID=UPI0004709E67|nr:protease modulator HflC [Sneathiella glossodoripedis]
MGKVLGIVLAVIVFIGGIVASSALFTVNETQQAMVMQFGEVKNVLTEPGLKVKVPFVQDVVFVERRVLSVSTSRSEVVTRDQKRLMVDSFARFKIIDPLLYYQSFGNLEVAFSRVETLVSSQVKQNLGREILTNIVSGERNRLMDQIKNRVNAETERRGVQVVDVRIVRTDLPKANRQKVFDRMRTQREQEAREIRAEGAEIAQRIKANADREKTVLLAEAKKDSEILRGQGDAEKNRIFAEAFGRDADFFSFYRSMQAYREAISDNDTTMVLSPNSDFFKYFGTKSNRPAQ